MEKIENDIATLILDKAFLIHRELGPGLLESIYERLLCHELKKSGINVASQIFIPFKWDEIIFENGFRADLIVDEKVIVDIKSVQVNAPVHAKQLMDLPKTYQIETWHINKFQ